MGWCDVRFRDPDRFVPPGADRIFYFAHSYHLLCDDPNEIVGVIDFGGDEIAVAVEREGVVGLQFHPEKSQDAGLDLLRTLLGRLA
jgi:glutamine amidotransferase